MRAYCPRANRRRSTCRAKINSPTPSRLLQQHRQRLTRILRQHGQPPPYQLCAVQRNDAPAWQQPIGTPIEYNPFATGDSPSLKFAIELATAAETAPQTSPAQVNSSPPPSTTSPADASAPPDDQLATSSAAEPTPFDDLPPPPAALLLPSAVSSGRAAPTSEEQSFADSVYHFGDTIVIDHGVFRAAYQQPLAPLQPLQPVQPQNITPTEPTLPGAALSPLAGTSIAELAAAVGGSPVQGVGQAQAQLIAPTDLGGLLQSANSVQSVNTTRRSPVALAPNIRGYEFNEIYSQANGAYWFPVREDLDSMLSKVDPGMVQNVVVIPGPYGVQYGPGLSFIDIEMSDTPRYDDGPGSDYRANGNIRTNGGQLYGRLTAEGGSDDYGYRISYGHRTGDDYTAGNGLSIPSSYDSGDVWCNTDSASANIKTWNGAFCGSIKGSPITRRNFST